MDKSDQITNAMVEKYKLAYSEALTSLLNTDCGGDIGFEATRIALASLSDYEARNRSAITLQSAQPDPLWQKLRDLFGMDGWHDGQWQGLPSNEQIVTHIEYVASERARLLLSTSEAATALASLSHTMGVKGDALDAQIAYACDLQRIIEDLCANRDIRTPERGSRHHYEMAVRYRSALTPMQQPVTIEQAARVLYDAWPSGIDMPEPVRSRAEKGHFFTALRLIFEPDGDVRKPALASPQDVPGWEKEREVLRKALTLAEGRIALLLEAYPDESDGCDHPTATRYVLSEIRAALNAEVSKS